MEKLSKEDYISQCMYQLQFGIDKYKSTWGKAEEIIYAYAMDKERVVTSDDLEFVRLGEESDEAIKSNWKNLRLESSLQDAFNKNEEAWLIGRTVPLVTYYWYASAGLYTAWSSERQGWVRTINHPVFAKLDLKPNRQIFNDYTFETKDSKFVKFLENYENFDYVAHILKRAPRCSKESLAEGKAKFDSSMDYLKKLYDYFDAEYDTYLKRDEEETYESLLAAERAIKERIVEVEEEEEETVDMSEEIWATIDGYEDYEISNFGNIRKGDKEIKTKMNTHNQKSAKISNGDKRSDVIIKKLVAQAFLSGEGKYIVHLDGDPDNCRVDNLQFSDDMSNTKTVSKYKDVMVKCKETGKILTIGQMSAETGISMKDIEWACEEMEPVNGYHFGVVLA